MYYYIMGVINPYVTEITAELLGKKTRNNILVKHFEFNYLLESNLRLSKNLIVFLKKTI